MTDTAEKRPDEIEVTDEMVAAGLEAIQIYGPGDIWSDVVHSVYCAMEAARRESALQ